MSTGPFIEWATPYRTELVNMAHVEHITEWCGKALLNFVSGKTMLTDEPYDVGKSINEEIMDRYTDGHRIGDRVRLEESDASLSISENSLFVDGLLDVVDDALDSLAQASKLTWQDIRNWHRRGVSIDDVRSRDKLAKQAREGGF